MVFSFGFGFSLDALSVSVFVLSSRFFVFFFLLSLLSLSFSSSSSSSSCFTPDFLRFRRPPVRFRFSPLRESLQQWRYVKAMLAPCLVQGPEGAGPRKRWRRGERGGANGACLSLSFLSFDQREKRARASRLAPPFSPSSVPLRPVSSIWGLLLSEEGTRVSPGGLPDANKKEDESSEGERARATTSGRHPRAAAAAAAVDGLACSASSSVSFLLPLGAPAPSTPLEKGRSLLSLSNSAEESPRSG